VIGGWEKGMEGACAGEKITLIVPPELAYGDSPSDKVFTFFLSEYIFTNCRKTSPKLTVVIRN
jgi:FKBP-type peptidyl-prolyl cis-trans isomerase 2